MPESNGAAKRRIQKANRVAGIGDADGKMVREKAAKPECKCTVCGQVVVITKSGADLKNHIDSKHSESMEVCFPGAQAIVDELAKPKKAGKEGEKKKAGGLSKKEQKAAAEAALFASMGAAPKKKKSSAKK
jgi:hypothetical protein